MSSPVPDCPDLIRELPGRLRLSAWFGSTKRYLGARNDTLKLPPPHYTSQAANVFGSGEHFQGIQRVGEYLILSAGIKTPRSERQSQLLALHMGSMSGRSHWSDPRYSSRGYAYDRPDPGDMLVQVHTIDETLWHAGGIQACGEIIGVPIYGDRSGSEIRFFRFARPAGFTALDLATLELSQEAKAVGLTRLECAGRYLLVVWDDRELHFFQSGDSAIDSGWTLRHRVATPAVLGHGFADGQQPLAGTYQSVNLVAARCNEVFMVCARNTQKVSPTFTGKDLLDVYRLRWTRADYRGYMTIRHVLDKQFYCNNQQCNFGAGAGIHVHSGDNVSLYATAHWLHDGSSRFNFNEYSRR